MYSQSNHMQSKSLFRIGAAVGTAVFLFLALFAALNASVLAAPDDNTYQVPPFSQDWTDTNLITTNDDWSGVPGIIGYRGDNLTALTGADPQTIVADGTEVIDVNANQTNPDTFATGGATEFEITDPVVALQGSGTADAPFLLVHLNTTGQNNIQVAYNLRDLDGSIDNAVQAVALQYRVGNSGNFTNLPDGFVADATTGPSLATLVTPVTVTLPAAADNQPQVQVRIITTNAAGNDEAVGIDDLSITSASVGPELSASKSVDPTTAVPHLSTITYTVVLENSGAVSDTNVLFTDTLPISTTFNSWVEQPVGASETADVITWSGTVTNGEAITFTFTADQTADYSATITNTAAFSGTTTGTAQAAFTVESTAGDVTFVYHDLEDVVQTGEGLFLAGDFNGWNTTSTPLTADSGYETFSVTVPALSVGAYNYKYVVYTDTIASGTAQYDWLNTNNRSYNVLGTATVNDYRNVVPGYAVLSGPATLTVTQTFPAGPISGELYINNVTNPAGEGRGLKAEVGFGSSIDPGVWTWFDAAFSGQNGNNDIFAGVITPPAPGVFSYTNRFNGNWGTGNPNSVWSYGDLNGVHPGNPFELSQTGVITVEAAGVCEINPSHLIHAIQGSGASTPISGQAVSVNAVVVGDYQVGGFNGFYVQEQDADVDANPMTSEGIFVYFPANTVDVAVGDVVYVAGTAAEFNGLTQITTITNVSICDSGATVTPADVVMPHTAVANLEWVEGMSVIFPDQLTVTDNYNMGRYGEIFLSSSGRQFQFTHLYTPSVAGYAAYEADILLNRILMDDGRTDQNPLVPMPYLDPDVTLRAGSTITNLTGVMGYGFSYYRIQPTDLITFTQSNPRENAAVDGSLKIASMNVLNYFTTIDTGAAICGPSENLDCRGADTLDELNRQRAKLLSAITGLDADVIGLMEIENNVNDDAVIDLLASLNAAVGAGTYAYIDTGTIGTDAIKVALIYKTARVTPVGDFAILDDSFDPDYQDNLNRPSLAQTFADNTTGDLVTVSVNHLKSKGCGGETGDDVDQLDGQGCWNATRTAAAEILATWLDGDPTGSGSDNFLIIGDLNSYAMEDPITALKNAGLTNLIDEFLGADAYSYSFNGEFGYLDYALASPGLLPYVNDTAEWHINSDEPRALDYNDFNQPFFFNPDEFRASDHDPVLVAINFAEPTISILSPTAGEVFTSTNGTAVSVPVTITTTNFTIPTDGHWHLWIDGVDTGPVMDYDTTVDLLPGAHVISAELNSPSHVSLGFSDSVSVTVNVQYILYLPVIMKP